jgi:hypothetical protein
MTELPPPPPVEGRFKKLAKKVVYPYGKKTPLSTSLRSRLRPGETEVALAKGYEKVPWVEVEMLMLVTDQRILWTYVAVPSQVLDLSFQDVVAFLGSEREGTMIVEAWEPRYREMLGGQTKLARFRFTDRLWEGEVVRIVERRIPAEARDLIPDTDGTGRHPRYEELDENS